AGWPTLRSRAAAENDFGSTTRTNVSIAPRRSMLVTAICRYGLGGITSDQRRQFPETAMDVDLDESCRLARRAGGRFYAGPLQPYQTDHAGLGGLQSPEQVVHHDGAYRRLPSILDRDFVGPRARCAP